MDSNIIVTAFVVLAKMLATLGHRDHALAQASDSSRQPRRSAAFSPPRAGTHPHPDP
jgi:hypothetical protein